MTSLKLGRLPKVGMTRMTFSLPEPLKEELDLYAAEHSRLYEPVDAAALIPHMLESFLRSDRGWRGRKAKTKPSNDAGVQTARIDTARRADPQPDQ